MIVPQRKKSSRNKPLLQYRTAPSRPGRGLARRLLYLLGGPQKKTSKIDQTKPALEEIDGLA
ncbi:hypothetical protein [Acidocella sp. KAb 2-4]|uniref:hypothetical protein n=1 Tax=Acidocella sp. KAb 2-4 TaxID=2885158 RepID=UPI001D08EBF0|nr:hypothetical protein [Acidocella sp. KAb 2-4]MCB5944039.1 hypothetical protein [Acidocella sp. KAb 2-4]